MSKFFLLSKQKECLVQWFTRIEYQGEGMGYLSKNLGSGSMTLWKIPMRGPLFLSFVSFL